MDFWDSELKIGRLDGTIPIKTNFLLIKYLLALVGSCLFLFAALGGALYLSPLWQGCKMMIPVGHTGVGARLEAAPPAGAGLGPLHCLGHTPTHFEAKKHWLVWRLRCCGPGPGRSGLEASILHWPHVYTAACGVKRWDLDALEPTSSCR